MIKETGSKSPRVRFKGFVEAWKQKRLGEIYIERNERGNDSLQILSVSIHSGVSNGELDIETLGKQVRRSEDKSLYKHVYAGDLVLNMMRAWQGAIGVAASEGMVSPAYITAVPNEAIYPPFMDFSLRRSQIVAQMNNLSYGVTDFRKRLYWDSFIRVAVHISSVAEQKKITDYLSRLDDVITLHQRKHDKLVALKQAMLQKMFPQDGATTPEIRFKGFEGDWEQRKLLRGVTKIIDFRGRTPKKLGLEWSAKGYLALSAVNVKNGFIDFSVDAHFGDDELYDAWMKGSELHKNQVLFTTEAPMGNVAQVPDDRKYILSQRTIAFDVDPSLLSEDFFAVLLRSPLMSKKLSSLSSGGTAKGVSQRSLESVTSVFPMDIKEQQRIGTYFCKLDKLIFEHATQVEQLKNIKSACLEEMFV